MIQLSILAMRMFALAFGVYHAVLGLLNLGNYQELGFVAAALIAYLAGLSLSIFSVGSLRLPGWVAVTNLIIAIAIPILVSGARTTGEPNPYTTWYVAALGTLLAITAVRGFPNLAWIGIAFLVAEVLAYGGLGAFFNSGLVGALLLVLGAQAAARALGENEVLMRDFRFRAVNIEAATAAKSAARLERDRRIQLTLNETLPQLQRIVDKKGKLTAQERKLATLTEAELRDQIRGRNLNHPRLVSETRAARSRGIEVQLLDDGGLDDLQPNEAAALLERAALELAKIKAGKVVIRSISGEDWRLSMVAIRKGAEQPDLFLRI